MVEGIEMGTPEEIEKLRQEKLARIVIDQVDSRGRKIHDVYATGDEFVIYSTGEFGSIKKIRVLIETINPDDRTPVDNFQTVKWEFDKLKAVSDKCRNPSYAARVAQALVQAILGNPDDSKAILTKIHDDIEEDYKELVFGKLYYLSGTYLIAVIMCSLGLYLHLYQPELIVKQTPILYELTLVCSLATLGGIISVSRNINTINVDKGLGKKPYFIYGIERNIFSVVGGIFIFFLIKSNLLFGFVNGLDDHFYGFLIFGFLAGFSETLIPNALRSLEERANNESNN